MCLCEFFPPDVLESVSLSFAHASLRLLIFCDGSGDAVTTAVLFKVKSVSDGLDWGFCPAVFLTKSIVVEDILRS